MPPKRKAKEVDAARSNAPQRARQSQKPKAPTVVVNLEDDDLEVISQPPAKRTRKPQPRAEQTDSIQKNVIGRSQKPATVEQHLMEQNAKSKEFIQAFREEVTKAQEDAHRVLEKLKHDLDKAHAGQQQELFAGGGNAGAEIMSTNAKENPLYRQTQDILRLCRSILRRHQTAEKEAQRPELVSPRDAWKQDEQEMATLLEGGKRYGERLAKSLLGPDGTISEDEAHEDGEDEDDGAQNLESSLFQKTRVAAETETWGQVAHAQLTALTSLVATLPVPKK